MQALLRRTAELMSTEGVRVAYQFSQLVQKVQPFRYLKDQNQRRCVEPSVGGWRASTPSRSAESDDRKWEDVGIGWARVETRVFRGNLNSHRVSPKGSTISTKEIIGTRCNQSEIGRQTRT